MSEYERVYREALEAAAMVAVEAWADAESEASPEHIANAIRALAPRIAAPSDNRTLHRSYADPGRARIPPGKPCQCRLTVGVPGRVCDGAGCIPPAPDDEALVEMVARILAEEECEAYIKTRTRMWSDMPEWLKGNYGRAARAALAALREAGALQ